MNTPDLEPAVDSTAPVVAAPVGPVRPGWRWWALALACLALGAGLAVPLARAILPSAGSLTTPTSSQIFTSTGGTFSADHGQAAAAFRLPHLRHPGSSLTLAQFRGHPVVLNFWASWCAPCRKEMPALEKVARQESGRISFVGINTNDQRGSALAFLAKTGVTYPVGSDPHATTAASYTVYGLPTTFFISASGHLLGHQVGALTEQRLTQLLHRLDPAAASPSAKGTAAPS